MEEDRLIEEELNQYTADEEDTCEVGSENDNVSTEKDWSVNEDNIARVIVKIDKKGRGENL